ncbi:MAG: lytic transglycosylase domain-containing protein [Salibacteraceae bacterium]
MSKFMKRTKSIGFISILMAILLSVVFIVLSNISTDRMNTDEDYANQFRRDYSIYALPLPDSVSFAGESVPLELQDVREKFDREMLVNTYWQSQTLLFIKRSHRWFPVIEPILAKHNIPDDFKYLALIESGFMDVVSPAGAVGFWQFMKDAGKQYGLTINDEIDERYHVEKATEAACRYLLDAKAKFGSWTLAAASYNMGVSGLERQINLQKATNYYDLLLNEETSRYVFRIVAAKTILNNPTRYGFHFRSEDLYTPFETRLYPITVSIDNFADFAFGMGINYKALKYLNPWLRKEYLTVHKGDTVWIKLPKEPSSMKLVNDKSIIDQYNTTGQ